jgi:hypothetical protein
MAGFNQWVGQGFVVGARLIEHGQDSLAGRGCQVRLAAACRHRAASVTPADQRSLPSALTVSSSRTSARKRRGCRSDGSAGRVASLAAIAGPDGTNSVHWLHIVFQKKGPREMPNMNPQPGATALPPLAIASALRDSLKELPAIFKNEPLLEAGIDLAELRGLSMDDLEALYEAASELCDSDAFEDALPISLQLAAHQPRNSKYVYIAASCLQRVGLASEAALLFGQCLLQNPHPMVQFRLGECMNAMGQTGAALHAFDTVYDMCRDDPDLRELQDWSDKARNLLKS